MDIEISKYLESDLSSIDLLFQELQIHENKFDRDKTTELDQARLYREDLLKTLQEQSGELLVAKIEKKIVGLIAWYIEKEIEYSIPYAYISDIVVTSRMRAKGIGNLLMEKAIENINKNNIKRIHIGVLLANSMAKEFYNKLGFEDYSIELVKVIK